MNEVKRHELKYRVSAQEAWVLRDRLAKAMPRDPYSQNGPYFIRSLYFDTPANTSFFDRVEGFERRTKFRLRFYEFSEKSVVKFEIKSKWNHIIIKETAFVKKKDLADILAGRLDCLAESGDSTLKKIYYHFKTQVYMPVVIVDYHREAFKLDYNQIRITFDTHLSKSSEVTGLLDPSLKTIPVLEKEHVILEIKYNHFFPGWLGDLVGAQNFRMEAQSKYCFARMV